MGTLVDFDLAVLILRVLEGWELGNSGLYTKYWSYIKKSKKKEAQQGQKNIIFGGKSGLKGVPGGRNEL